MNHNVNRFVFVILGIVCLCTISPAAFSQEAAQVPVSQEEVSEQNRISEPDAVVTAVEMLEEWKEEAFRKLKIQEGVSADGKYAIFASASVSLKDTDPHYGDALVNAFDVAMMEAQQRMLMDRFGRLVVEKSRETFRDQSSNNAEIPLEASPAPGKSIDKKALRILDKTLSVAEAKLDKALEEYGVPRNEYENQPPEKKKVLFRNAFLKQTMKTASGEIAGVFPVQTTVKKDTKGTTKVGVILMMSPKSVQVATDIRMQRPSLIRGKGSNLHERMVPKTPSQWIGQLGTRLVYDIDGTPVIVSYGMGSYVPQGDDDYINEELREEAKKQALDNADAQIAEVVAGRMCAEQQRIQGETIERAVTRKMKMDAPTIEKTMKDMLKQSSSFAKSKASMNLQGISTLSTKYIKLPSGQQMCYVIRYWSYAGFNAVNNLNRAAADPKKATGNQKATGNKKGTGAAHNADGFQVNDVDDF